MKRTWIVLLSFAIALACAQSRAQEPETSGRKVVSRVRPTYPTITRDMALKGVAKVEALVEPNGSVKTVRIRGGHPLLTQAAVNAVSKWRWENSSRETWETVEVKFEGR